MEFLVAAVVGTARIVDDFPSIHFGDAVVDDAVHPSAVAYTANLVDDRNRLPSVVPFATYDDRDVA